MMIELMFMTEKSLDSSGFTIAWDILIEKLENALTDILLEQALELSEYDLIRQLTEEPYFIFDTNTLSDQLNLFQTHFVLFHVLYRLRDQWQSSRQCWLDISPLSIKIVPCHQFTKGGSEHYLTENDALKNYYNDLSHLGNTSREDVEHLLTSFWQKYLNPKQRLDALLSLNCTISDDWPTIKSSYRKLAMQAHPDRGGDHDQFTKIQQAYELLKIYHEE